ncbi:MAG: galactonate dehydratase [Chloroflexota bacterium]
MKIRAIAPIVVNARMRNWVFVKFETDEGITGWGEASLEWKTRGVAGCIGDLSPLVVGEDPTRIEHLYQILYRQGFFRPGVVGMSAISGIEQACWDIFGKSVGLPVYKLLGGLVRDRIRLYDHLGGGDMQSLYLDDQPEIMAERARRSVADGFTAVKVLVVPRTLPLDGIASLRHAERCMAAIREAVGDNIDIMVDLHGRAWPEMAIQYADTLTPYRPWFFEEPVPPENVDALAQVARAIRVPVATGERLVTRYEFREVLEKRACGILQPDLCHCGGLLEARKIAAMAEAYYVSIAPHNPLGPVATAAALQFGAATPNFLIQEHFRSDVPWRDEVLVDPLAFDRGFAYPTQRPGLGVEVDEAAAARHPFQQEEVLRYFHPDTAVADW